MPTGTLSRVRTHVRRLQQTTRNINLKVSTTIKNEEQKTQEKKR
jgi:branched-subunit amino acid aminotransferase/4-amino-4-deoxychorismate lyase